MDKLSALKEILTSLGGVLIAFSGGVDSTLLARVALDCLPRERLLAVTAHSPFRTAFELETAKGLAAEMGLPHLVIETGELTLPAVAGNAPDRCYHCKKTLFAVLREMARERGLPWVADGTNADDRRGYRPGLRATAELEVRSPLAEAGLGKAEIRALSREQALPNWDQPAYSCLATRFPYHTNLTPAGLGRVEQGEEVLRDLGLRQVRLRDHGDVARVEVGPEEMDRAFAVRGAIVAGLRAAGYKHVALDLEGYRSGSFDGNLSN